MHVTLAAWALHDLRSMMMKTVGCVLATVLAALMVAVLAVVPGGEHVPMLLALPILACAYLFGRGPGLIATAIALAGSAVFLHCDGVVVAYARPVAFLLVGTTMTMVIDALRRARITAARHQRVAEHSSRQFLRLFEASPMPKSLSQIPDGVVIAVNSAYLRLFGVKASDIVGSVPSNGGVVVESRLHDDLFERLRRGQPIEGVDVTVHSPAGVRELLLWSRAEESDGINITMTTFVDVTARNLAQRGMRASEDLLRDVVDNIAEVTWLTDAANAQMLYVSPAYEKIFGRSAQSLYADPRSWLLAVHPDDRERMSSRRGWRKTGLQDSYRVLTPDGTVRTIEIRTFPIRDASGTVLRIAGVASDVTERLVLEEQVRETQKLESLGLLAGGVAHDFNNVLAVISANLGMLAESFTNPADRELVDDIDSAVVRATGLTRQLLAFSRKQPVEAVVIDLNAAVKDIRKMLRRMVGEDIVFTTSFEPELMAVKIDPGYLVQVLMNLAVNARDAMPRGGTLALTTRNITERDQVLLEITDTGTGMTPEVRARVFEPFFTTKEHGKGTGLGLSVVHGIIEQAGGRLELDSELGTGTTFRIYLPACHLPVEHIAHISFLSPGGTEKILVVDDDRFVRISTSRALRARGYTVVEARDGRDALVCLREHAGITLLVTDVIMPGMDGGELARAARLERPDLKVLFTSGYTDDALLEHGIRPLDGGFLEKPFHTHALAGKVRQIIDAA
ncbi:hypothetical protein BH11MYX3_BH11MYX3_03500 [soil metagenome]